MSVERAAQADLSPSELIYCSNTNALWQIEDRASQWISWICGFAIRRALFRGLTVFRSQRAVRYRWKELYIQHIMNIWRRACRNLTFVMLFRWLLVVSLFTLQCCPVFDQLTRDRWRDFTMPGEAFVGGRPFRSDCADRCVLPVDRFHVEPDILLSDPLEQ